MTAIESRPRRWDPVVRLTHWSVVAAVIANALITEEGSASHIWVGYALAAILALRLIWGFIGPSEARFTAFAPSPRRVIAHLRDIAAGRVVRHASHNPLGALMVYAIWSTLGVIIVSGVIMAGVPAPARVGGTERSPTVAAAPIDDARDEPAGKIGHGEDEGEEGDREDEPLAEIHESAVNLLYGLIALHIAGVLFETRRGGRHIVMAMLPGRR